MYIFTSGSIFASVTNSSMEKIEVEDGTVLSETLPFGRECIDIVSKTDFLILRLGAGTTVSIDLLFLGAGSCDCDGTIVTGLTGVEAIGWFA